DSGNTDGARADVADVVTPSGLRDIGRGAGGWVQCGEVRDPPSPGDHRAHEHGDADRDSDEVSDSKERERETEVETGRGAIVAQAEVTRHVAGENTGLDDDVKHGRYDGAPHHGLQARGTGI